MSDQEIKASVAAISLLREIVIETASSTYQKFSHDVDRPEEILRLSHYIRDSIIDQQHMIQELEIRKRKTEQLTSELDTFKLAVENAADYIIILNDDMKIIYANKSALTGMELKDVIGKTVPEVFLPPGSGDIIDPLYEHIAKGDKQFVTESTLPGPNGVLTVFQTMTTVTHDAQGQRLIISIGRNITKERALEREKDEFVSIASHELRTPMTAIRGYINLLERERLGPLNTEQKEVLEKMNRNAKALIEFVGNMLDLSKLEAKKLAMRPVDSSLDDLIKVAVEKIRVLYEGKGIALEYHGVPARILTDPLHFDRVLSNLLGNAYKFTPTDGSVTITATIDRDAGIATVCVADTGVGIPTTSVEGLFKRFSQVGNVLQRQSEGTGLGLAICKDLVEQLGGKIWVTSKPGSGSQFYFTTPLTAEDADK